MSNAEKTPQTAKEDRILRLLPGAVLLFCGATGLLFLYFHPPGTTRWLPQCLFYRLTGFYCAGCGSTRALYAALHGDFAASLRSNLLLFPLLALLCGLFWKPHLALRPWIAITVPALLVLYGILRNLPMYPFLLLAPH